MNFFPDYSKLPTYKILKDEQKQLGQILDDENLQPIIFENFLSAEELSYIQNRYENYPIKNISIKNFYGAGTVGDEPGKEKIISEEIINRIVSFASKMYGEELEFVDISKTIYSLKFGPIVSLLPHYDSKPIQTLIFDLQINSNHDWGFTIEGKTYNLKNGDAILFNATTQCHWREQKQFSENDKTSLVFISLQHKNKKQCLSSDYEIKDKRIRSIEKDLKIDKEKIQKIINNSQIKSTRDPLKYAAKYNNIFTEDEIASIYESINLDSDENTSKVSIYGQKVWHTQLPQNIIDKVTHQMKIIHNQDFILEAMSFARYSKEYSDIPILTPHYDNTFKEPRVTLDVQLRSNISWDIIVENSVLKLQDNEAATFSGTHQIHWRDPIIFKDGDFIEMLFCHFIFKDSKPITIEDKKEIESKMMRFSNEFAVSLFKKNQDLLSQLKRYTYE